MYSLLLLFLLLLVLLLLLDVKVLRKATAFPVWTVGRNDNCWNRKADFAEFTSEALFSYNSDCNMRWDADWVDWRMWRQPLRCSHRTRRRRLLPFHRQIAFHSQSTARWGLECGHLRLDQTLGRRTLRRLADVPTSSLRDEHRTPCVGDHTHALPLNTRHSHHILYIMCRSSSYQTNQIV